MIFRRERATVVRHHHAAVQINWWQLATIALATLTLCACRTEGPHGRPGAAPGVYDDSYSGPSGPGAAIGQTKAVGMPAAAMMNGPMTNDAAQSYAASGRVPLAVPGGVPGGSGVVQASYNMAAMGGPCCPPPAPQRVFCDCGQGGERNPLHPDEYLCDGGDRDEHVNLNKEGIVRGLGIEDTVASYECHDGTIHFEPSNRVCLYAPRFASVRKVDGAISSDQIDVAAGIDKPVAIVRRREALKPGAAMQPLPPVIGIANRTPLAVREPLRAEGLDDLVKLVSLQDRLLPYEDFQYIRVGIMQADDKPLIAQRAQAAIVWTKDQGVQVIIDNKRAAVEESIEKAMLTYFVEEPECPRLRVCKVASSHDALPGEEVDFTIRFDNVGHSAAKNVVLYDNLTTRLEYIPNSAQASVKAEFFSQVNEADSLVLKWTILEPIEPGRGGVVRFKCRVK